MKHASAPAARHVHDEGCRWLQSAADIVAYTGDSEDTIGRWYAARAINHCPIVKVSRRLRVKTCAIDAWIADEARREERRGRAC